MLEIKSRLAKQKIVSANIVVSRKPLKNLTLEIECRAKVRTPSDDKDGIVLLNMELKISTQNDDLNISLNADIIFELDQIPEDYITVAEQKLIPLARTSLYEKLDEILVSMGYQKMGLAEKM